MISTWSSGTGGAGVIGALSYASLTTVLSIENTLLVMLIAPLLQAITFWCVLKHPAHTGISITKNGTESQEQIIQISEKSIRDKINLVPGLLKYMIPLGLVYLFGYFINQGLVYDILTFSLFSPDKITYLLILIKSTYIFILQTSLLPVLCIVRIIVKII